MEEVTPLYFWNDSLLVYFPLLMNGGIQFLKRKVIRLPFGKKIILIQIL